MSHSEVAISVVISKLTPPGNEVGNSAFRREAKDFLLWNHSALDNTNQHFLIKLHNDNLHFKVVNTVSASCNAMAMLYRVSSL